MTNAAFLAEVATEKAAMKIVAMPYGTFQVRGANGLMIIECAKRSDCVDFIGDPVRYGYGLCGGPRRSRVAA